MVDLTKLYYYQLLGFASGLYLGIGVQLLYTSQLMHQRFAITTAATKN